MIAVNFSLFSLIISSCIFGAVCVAIAVMLVRQAQARHDARNFSKGMKRLSQNDIDCARS